MGEAIHRIIVGAPITPNELRLAALFALIWFVMDAYWFICTAFHWAGF